MYICLCKGVTDNQIRQCAKRGVRCLADLSAQLGVATGCGQCADYAAAILDEEAPPYLDPQAPLEYAAQPAF